MHKEFTFLLSEKSTVLKIKSDDMIFWKKSIENETYTLWDYKRKNKEEPKKTRDHEPWWKLINGELKKDIWIKPIRL